MACTRSSSPTPNPIGFKLKVDEIKLSLNEKDPQVTYLAGDFYYPTVTITTGNKIDLSIRNATGVAVSSDLQYAFVGDWYVPRMYYQDYESAFLIEEKVSVGSKVGIVFDPFKLGTFNAPNGIAPGTIMAATSPIPMSFLEDVVLDATGKKLYANFRGAGNVAGVRRRQDDDAGLQQQPELRRPHQVEQDRPRPSLGRLRLGRAGREEPPDPTKPPNPYSNPGRPVQDDPRRINLQAIDLPSHTRGLSIQTPPVLTLLNPGGEVDTDLADASTLKFEWEVEYELLGGNPNNLWTTRLYVSSQAPGAGLWPDDPYRDRPEEGLLSNLYSAPEPGRRQGPQPGPHHHRADRPEDRQALPRHRHRRRWLVQPAELEGGGRFGQPEAHHRRDRRAGAQGAHRRPDLPLGR